MGLPLARLLRTISACPKKEIGSVSNEWTTRLRHASSKETPGHGTDVRLEGDRLVGAMLLVDETPVHLEAFADVGG